MEINISGFKVSIVKKEKIDLKDKRMNRIAKDIVRDRNTFLVLLALRFLHGNEHKEAYLPYDIADYLRTNFGIEISVKTIKNKLKKASQYKIVVPISVLNLQDKSYFKKIRERLMIIFRNWKEDIFRKTELWKLNIEFFDNIFKELAFLIKREYSDVIKVEIGEKG